MKRISCESPVVLAVLLASGVFWLGCGSESHSPCDLSGIKPLPCEVGDVEAAADPEQILGGWVGVQNWVIHFQFSSDGTFEKSDRIAPCSEGSRCFWSGIVDNHGEWTLSGSKIVLQYINPQAREGATTPEALFVTSGCEMKLNQPAEKEPQIIFLRRGCQ